MPKLQLLDAIPRETGGFGTVVQLSLDGNKAFVVYNINAVPAITLAAELFDVSGDTLVSLATYNVDLSQEYKNICVGAANNAFTKFAIVEASDTNDMFKVSLLQQLGTQLVSVQSRTLGGIIQGYTMLCGNFLRNDAAFLVSASVDTVGDNQRGRLWLLDATTLNTVDVITSNFVYTTSAVTMRIHNVNYVAVTTSQGILDFNDLPKLSH